MGTSGTELGTESNKELESFNGLHSIKFLNDIKLGSNVLRLLEEMNKGLHKKDFIRSQEMQCQNNCLMTISSD